MTQEIANLSAMMSLTGEDPSIALRLGNPYVMAV